MFIVNTTTISLVAGLSVSYLLRILNQTLMQEQDARQKLSDETEKIKSINITYENEIERRRQAERELSISEEKYKFLIGTIPSVTWMSDEHGRTTFISPNVQRVLGYSSDEIYENGNTLLLGRIHPDDLKSIRLTFQKMFQLGLTADVEYRFRKKDGSWIWIHDKAVQAIDKDGKKYTFGVFSDATERKHAENTLRENEKLYHALVETTNTGFVVIDDGGAVIDSNQEYVRLSGHRTIDEILGRSVLEWTADYEKEKNSEAVKQCIQNGSIRNFEIDYMHPGGNIIPVEINATVIEKDGKQQILTLCRDITERKRAEEEKKKLQDQLIQSQKMEAIGTLAGGIAHDFNNILTAIVGFTELARISTGKGTDAEKNLSEVLKAGDRAKELVKHILSFSRYSKYELKPINAKNAIKEVLKLIRATLPSTIEIRQNIVSDSIIMADTVQIHQILMNLCSNASHAMEEGGILEISLTDVNTDAGFLKENPDAAPGAYIKLTVSDTGHGMTPEIIERIFDPYFTTKAKGEGTGLGLAVVHGIVKSYKGMIIVRSQPGKGSGFDIFLPVEEGQPGFQESKDMPLPTGKERILFIDDEPVLVKLGKEMLEKLNYKVTICTSSAEALELFKAEPCKFDIVITDMTMPGMTGHILALEIMRIRADIPVILCSGFNEKMNEKTALQLGIKAFIEKPFAMQNIAFIIREVLESNNSKPKN